MMLVCALVDIRPRMEGPYEAEKLFRQLQLLAPLKENHAQKAHVHDAAIRCALQRIHLFESLRPRPRLLIFGSTAVLGRSLHFFSSLTVSSPSERETMLTAAHLRPARLGTWAWLQDRY